MKNKILKGFTFLPKITREQDGFTSIGCRTTSHWFQGKPFHVSCDYAEPDYGKVWGCCSKAHMSPGKEGFEVFGRWEA